MKPIQPRSSLRFFGRFQSSTPWTFTRSMRTLPPPIINPSVTITPYLSRDTTYCYRHCKGISRFPLLLHHPSPRPMPDRTTSTSLTFAYVITPYRTHASNPHHVYCLTDSFVPLISLPHSPLDVTMTYDSDSDSNPYPFHDIIAYRSPTIRPLPLTLTIRTAIRYWLIPLHDGHFPLSLTYCTIL